MAKSECNHYANPAKSEAKTGNYILKWR